MNYRNFILLTNYHQDDSFIKTLSNLILQDNKNNKIQILILSSDNEIENLKDEKNAILIIYINNAALDFGLEIVLELRKKGKRLPILLLTWFNPKKVWVDRHSRNIFLSPYYNESCKLLRLPFSKNDFDYYIKNLKPLCVEDLIKGLFFYFEFDLHHQLERTRDYSTIKNRMIKFIRSVKLIYQIKADEYNNFEMMIKNSNSKDAIINSFNSFKDFILNKSKDN